MDTTQFKTIGFEVCEPHFKNEAAMTTWVLRRLNGTNKAHLLLVIASPEEVVQWWEKEIAEEKEFVRQSIGEPYEPKPWEALSHLIL